MSIKENKTLDLNYMGHNLIKHSITWFSCIKCNSCICSWVNDKNETFILMEDPEYKYYYLEVNLSCNEVLIKNIIE